VFFYFLRELGRGMMLPGGVAVNSVQFEMGVVDRCTACFRRNIIL